MAEFTIRSLTRNELHLPIDWAAAEGWNPGLYDADAFYAAGPDGFLLGELDQQPIAAISAVKYGTSFGFLGFYLVQPAYRGRGYGLRIWQAALARLAGRNIGLDGVVAQQDNYKKSGFTLAYRNIRYAGVTGGSPVAHADLVDLRQTPPAEVAAYDQRLFPAPRHAFLHAWLQQPEAVALGLRQQGRLTGYGMIRPCRTGYKIGPLFADSPEQAATLLQALRSRVPAGQPFYLDTPEINPAAVALAEQQPMQVVFETARMYTGPAPMLPLQQVFGVTSFELG